MAEAMWEAVAVGRFSNLRIGVASLSSSNLGFPQCSYKDTLVTMQSSEERRGGGGGGEFHHKLGADKAEELRIGKRADRAVCTAHNELGLEATASHTLAASQVKGVGGGGRNPVGLAKDDALTTLKEF